MIIGAISAALGVVLGAFGAHGLKPILTPEQMQVFETGVKYQMYHSFALLVAGLSAPYCNAKMVKYSTYFFLIGIILFSGSLYLMTALKINGQVGLGGLGLLTPIGGLFFILAWLVYIISIFQKK